MTLHAEKTDQRILTATDWAGYLQCRQALDRSGVKLTYDEGMLEIMSPSEEHEHSKSDLGHLLSAWLEETGIDYAVGGGPTMRIPGLKGLEPDDSFYIGSRAALRQAEPPPGRDVNPPDIVVEVEVTRSALDRLDIFRRLGVSEVWRYVFEEKGIHIHRLQASGDYIEQRHSSLLPDLDVATLARYVSRGTQETTGQIVREFRAWVREGCPPP